jgi:amidase
MAIRSTRTLAVVAIVAGALFFVAVPTWRAQAPFQVMETTIADVHSAYKSGQLTARQLVQMYLQRIETYDKQGPKINSVITINPKALEEADRLDAAFKASGFVGPLHGIPLVLKDQVDMGGLPTTMGSIVRKDFIAARDAFVVDKVKKAGGIFIAKVTLGEMGGGDTYGSLFGATRNPYDLLRTPGGSSGGPGASIAANFAMAGIGQEGSASVRRPSAWNSLVGLRPTRGLVSSTRGSTGLSPMARTVTDAAKLLDAMVGYDPEDMITAHGVGYIPKTYTEFLDKNGLRGARIGVFSESVGIRSNPNAEDFKEIERLFNRAVGELKTAGAEVIPIAIPHVKELMVAVDAGSRALRLDEKDPWANYPNRPYKNEEEMRKSPDYKKVFISPNRPGLAESAFTLAREQLLMVVLKVMADNRLDAIVHRSVEHSPSLIEEGLNPPYKNMDGAIRLNTMLWWASNVNVPAGYTSGGLPVGITFLGRPYAEPVLIKLAYGYEQATHYRKPPSTTPEIRQSE